MDEKTLLQLALHAAVEAGRAIMDIYEDPDADFGVEHKADNSPLTLADKRAHEAIAARLAESGLPLLSEEGRHAAYAERSGWRSLWIVDPLDGTKEFIKRNGEFTVNIALIKEGVPVLGVVYVPVAGDLYFASGITGARKIEALDIRITPERIHELADAGRRLPLPGNGQRPFTVVASRSHLTPETECCIEALRQQHPDLQIVSCGSSIKICRVAEGLADVYPRFAPTMEWDTAAGHAVARAAGYEMYRYDTRDPLVYNKEDLLNPWFVVRSKYTQTESL